MEQPQRTPRPWVLAENNLAQVRENDYQVVVVPLGATEPHNLHLPYGTDLFEAETLAQHICGWAWQRGARVCSLPAIPFGTETNLREFPLAINLNPSTVNLVLKDIVTSLVGSGVRKIVLLNSHGGNELKPFLREVAGQIDAQVFLCNWYHVIRDVYDQIFDVPEDHAGEMETSFALEFFPELVSRNDDGSLAADNGSVREPRFEALRQGWVSITRPWHLLTTNSGAANPHAASAAKGRRLMELLESRIGQFLVELSAAELDDHFPY